MGHAYITPSGVKRYFSDYLYGILAVFDGKWTGGKWQGRFIRELKKYTGTDKIVLVNSGSSANLVAMAACKKLVSRYHKNANKVVACVANFPTTVNPILQCGMEPFWVDAMPDSLAPSMEEITEILRDNDTVLGAIIAVPMGKDFEIFRHQKKDSCGYSYSLGFADELLRVAYENSKFVIFDVCDAIGFMPLINTENSPLVMATYSFYPAHHVTTGEGGAVACYNQFAHTVVQQYANWGRGCTCAPGQDNKCGNRFNGKWGDLPRGYDHKYVYQVQGYNLKMTDMSAAIGCSQLRHFNGNTRFVNALDLYTLLKKANLYQFLNFDMMRINGNSPFGFVIALQPGLEKYTNDFINYLEKNNIGTRRYFGGNLLRQPAYYSPVLAKNFPNANYITENVLWVGCHDKIGHKDIIYMADTIIQYFKNTEITKE